jgi:hypothetical protein
VTGCSFQAGYNPTYLPDEEPEYLSASEVLLLMADEEEDFVFSGSPTSFTGWATNLTIPLGTILKETAEEILEDRFSGGTDFSNELIDPEAYLIILHPSIKRFEYRYNQLKNAGFAITPEVDIDLNVEILDREGVTIFDQDYTSGYISGDTYFISGSPAEKVNKILHKTLYDLLETSFSEARPIVIKRIEQMRGNDM